MKIIFFDGFCGLCDGFVGWVLPRDKKKIFYFSPLQGETAKAKIPGFAFAGSAPASIVFLDGESLYLGSEAVLKILSDLGGGWVIFGIFQIVPAKVRDGLYYFVARNRYRWFGRRLTCRQPSGSLRSRFLS